jgi:glycosyltransferase involved in cell wall biosynthesis
MWTNEIQSVENGFQVLLSVYNGEEHLERCLKSIDQSMRGRDWILLLGDDESIDGTLVEFARYARSLTCDKVHLYDYDKAQTVAEAKNRLIKEAHNFKLQYPYILMMDADDQMLPERPRMANTAQETGAQYVVGSWEKQKKDGRSVNKSYTTYERLTFGPWATLFHCDFLPQDGKFFPEGEQTNTGFEDILAWYHLKYIEKKEAVCHPSSEPVHRYIIRDESASNTQDKKTLNQWRNKFWGISDLIKHKSRNIYTNPVSAEEAEEAKQAYIKRKEKENAQKDPH